jgi:hypothetical protein
MYASSRASYCATIWSQTAYLQISPRLLLCHNCENRMQLFICERHLNISTRYNRNSVQLCNLLSRHCHRDAAHTTLIIFVVSSPGMGRRVIVLVFPDIKWNVMPPVQDECRSCSRLGGDFVGKTYSKIRWVRLWFLDRRMQDREMNLAYLFRRFPNLRTRRRVASTTDEGTTHFRNVDSSLTSQKIAAR